MLKKIIYNFINEPQIICEIFVDTGNLQTQSSIAPFFWSVSKWCAKNSLIQKTFDNSLCKIKNYPEVNPNRKFNFCQNKAQEKN